MWKTICTEWNEISNYLVSTIVYWCFYLNNVSLFSCTVNRFIAHLSYFLVSSSSRNVWVLVRTEIIVISVYSAFDDTYYACSKSFKINGTSFLWDIWLIHFSFSFLNLGTELSTFKINRSEVVYYIQKGRNLAYCTGIFSLCTQVGK